MKYRQNEWDGEFETYDEWARFGPQPPYRGAKSGSHSTLPLGGARFDIKAYGVKEDAALPEDAGTVFVR